VAYADTPGLEPKVRVSGGSAASSSALVCESVTQLLPEKNDDAAVPKMPENAGLAVMAEVSAEKVAGDSDEPELPVSSIVAVYEPVGTGIVVPRTPIDSRSTVYQPPGGTIGVYTGAAVANDGS